MTTLDKKRPATWTGADMAGGIYFATATRIWKVYESKQGCALVWPDEGSFSPDGETWTFNRKHAGEFEPLWIDPTTAAALHALYSALQEDKNKEKVRDWIRRDRGLFARMVQIAWEACTR